MAEKPRTLSIAISLLPVVTSITMLAIAVYILRGDSLEGVNQTVLLTATLICFSIAVSYYKIKRENIGGQIARNIYGIAPSVIILLLIGTLLGSWTASGIVPFLIYYGLRAMQTDLSLAACCLPYNTVSIMTDSSWTTTATIGVALIGVGKAQGFNTGQVAGAIIPDAYFGDKMLPLSDIMILAASVTDAPLFAHIRYMLYTTVPSMIVTLIVFGIVELSRETVDAPQIATLFETLKGSLHITPWLMVVPIVTGIIITKKILSTVVLFASSILAGIFALIFQPSALLRIFGITDSEIIAYIKGLPMTLYDSTQVQTGSGTLNSLVFTRGMARIMNTIWLIICAMCFGRVMPASDMLESIIRIFLRFMRGRTSMVASTVVFGLSSNICTADQFVVIILNSEVFREVYKQRRFESRLLSRTTEDSIAVTSVLIPQMTCGMTQPTTLGVSIWTYFPYCIFDIVSPFMSVLIAAAGYRIVQKTMR